MNFKHLLKSFFCFLFFLGMSNIHAQSITFTGNGDGTTWEDFNNWDLGRVPSIGDNTIIPTGFSVISSTFRRVIDSLSIAASASLQVSETMLVGETQNDGILRINAGKNFESNIINNGFINNSGKLLFIDLFNNNTLTNNGDGIIFPQENEITLSNDITNNGVINNSGEISCEIFINKNLVTNNAGGFIECKLENHKTINNSGKIKLAALSINVEGTPAEFINLDTLELTSSFAISKTTSLSNSGVILSTIGSFGRQDGEISNGGLLTNKVGGRIVLDGLFNDNQVINEGFIEVDIFYQAPDRLSNLTVICTNTDTLIVEDFFNRADASIFNNSGVILFKFERADLEDIITIINEGKFNNLANGKMSPLGNGQQTIKNIKNGIFTNEGILDSVGIENKDVSFFFNRQSGKIAALSAETPFDSLPNLFLNIFNEKNATFSNEGSITLNSRSEILSKPEVFLLNAGFFENKGIIKTSPNFSEQDPPDTLIINQGFFSNPQGGSINLTDPIPFSVGIVNANSFSNKGSIDIGNLTKQISESGIINKGNFTHESPGIISFVNINKNGVDNQGIFNNKGQINFGVPNGAINQFGIVNRDTFVNSLQGELFLNNISSTAIKNEANASFFNERGRIFIAPADFVLAGIINKGTFTHLSDETLGGIIKIFIAGTGILNEGENSKFISRGILEVGVSGSITGVLLGGIGITNEGQMTNEIGGSIQIENVIGIAALFNKGNGIFINKNSLNITQNFVGVAILNDGSFSNESCARLTTDGGISNSDIFTNNGFIKSTNPQEGSQGNSGQFVNNSIIEDHFNSFKGINMTNNGIIIAPFDTDEETDPLLDILQIGRVVGNYNIETAWNNVSGGANSTYLPASNELDLASLLTIDTFEFRFDITDSDGACTQEMSLFVNVRETPQITCTNTKTNETDSLANGSLSVVVTGNYPPFSVAWTGPNGFSDTLFDINNLEAGIYSVTVMDSIGADTTCLDTIFNIITLSCTLDLTPAFDGQDDGSATVNITGGLAPYTIAWTGPNGFSSSNQNISNLAPGNYTATINDADGQTTICSGNIENLVPFTCSTNIKWTGGTIDTDENGQQITKGDGVSWNDPFNWDLERVPISTDGVEFNSATMPFIFNTNLHITIPDGTKLVQIKSTTAGFTFDIVGSLEITCSLEMEKVAGDLTIPGTLTGSGATFSFDVIGTNKFTLNGAIEMVGLGNPVTILKIEADEINLNGDITIDNQIKGNGQLMRLLGDATNNATITLNAGASGIEGMNENNGSIIVHSVSGTAIHGLLANKAGGTINIEGCSTGMFIDAVFQNDTLINDGTIEIGISNLCEKGIDGNVVNNNTILMKKVNIGIGGSVENNGQINIGFLGNTIEEGITGTLNNFNTIEIIGFNEKGVNILRNHPNATALIEGDFPNFTSEGVSKLLLNEGTVDVSECNTGIETAIEPNNGLIKIDGCNTGMSFVSTNNGVIEIDDCNNTALSAANPFAFVNKIENFGSIKIGLVSPVGTGFLGSMLNQSNGVVHIKEADVGIQLSKNDSINNLGMIILGVESAIDTVLLLETGIFNEGVFINQKNLLIHGFLAEAIINRKSFAKLAEFINATPNGVIDIAGAIDTDGSPFPPFGIINDSHFKNEHELSIKGIGTTGIDNFVQQIFPTGPPSGFFNTGILSLNSIGININNAGAQAIQNRQNALFLNEHEIYIGTKKGNPAGDGIIKGVGIYANTSGSNISTDTSLFINAGLIEIDNIISGGKLDDIDTGHGILSHQEESRDVPDGFNFINQSEIHIGNNKSIGNSGIRLENEASFSGIPQAFSNEFNSFITINRTGKHGIHLGGHRIPTVFQNDGAISIGNQDTIGGNGILVDNGLFENFPVRVISINNTKENGIELRGDIKGSTNFEAIFENEGVINIGQTGQIEGNGILLSLAEKGNSIAGSRFNNHTDAEIIIDRCHKSGIKGINRLSVDDGNINFRNESILKIGRNIAANEAIMEHGVDIFRGDMDQTSAASLEIDNVDGHGMNLGFGDFSLDGTIKIGITKGIGLDGMHITHQSARVFQRSELDIKKVGGNGIFIEDASFKHLASNLNIDETGKNGIFMDGFKADFTNSSSITIGFDAPIGANGMSFDGSAVFDNNSFISIQNAVEAGIKNDGKFNNTLSTSFIQIVDCPVGIENNRVFINFPSATIEIAGFEVGIFNKEEVFSGTNFLNMGLLTTINNPRSGIDIGLKNEGGSIFDNRNCAQFRLFGKFINPVGNTIKNSGFFRLGFINADLEVFANEGTFTNNGVIEDVQVRLKGQSITNNEILLHPTCIGDGATGLIDNVIQLGGNNNFGISTNWVVSSPAGLSVGIYNQVANQVNFPTPRANGGFFVTFSITDNQQNCTVDFLEEKPTFSATGQTIAVEAGLDQLLECDTMTTLAGNSPTGANGEWSFVNVGDGQGVIAELSNPSSKFTGSPGESYTLQWTLTAACGSDSDDVIIEFEEANDTIALAGLDQFNLCDTMLILAANIPSDSATGTWTIEFTSDGLALIEEPNNPTSQFIGHFGQLYILRWTMVTECDSTFDEVILEFAPDENGDGICDLGDACPNDPNKTEPGICGCGVADTDTDADGTPDCNDPCPNDATDQCGCAATDLEINENPIAGKIFATSEKISSEGRVDSDSTVVFNAGVSITLKPGFHAEAGSNFTAKIEGCVAVFVDAETERSTTRKGQSSSVISAIFTSNKWGKESDLPNLKVYPNPMQVQTTLEITLSESTDIYLNIYDLNGRKISTLVNGESLSKGVHNYQWQCEQVQAGMYLLVMNGRNAGKLVVVR